jgi:lipoate---protein ligase
MGIKRVLLIPDCFEQVKLFISFGLSLHNRVLFIKHPGPDSAMHIAHRLSTDPFENIAAEEYFVRNTEQDLCMIWSNQPSVIIGKHQNAYAEINYPFVRDHHIPVIRRISGGGAVYHDEGNLNFTFIRQTGGGNQVEFGRFTRVIIGYIQTLGIEVSTNSRNSLFAGGKKFSGHAEHLFHGRILHHGTLLFDTDLSVLEKSLQPAAEFKSKAMPSVRSEVVNLSSLLPGMTKEQFTQRFLDYLYANASDPKAFTISDQATAEIRKLAGSKYRSWEWNFGYSPAYEFRLSLPDSGSGQPITVEVKNGIISGIRTDAHPGSDYFAERMQAFIGIPHREEAIRQFAATHPALIELLGTNAVSFTEAFFSQP